MVSWKKRKDYLYIGDENDETVKTFDAETGQYLGIFVTSESGNLHGPRGLIFDHQHNLLVTNQNVEQPQNGEVLKYKKQTGQFRGELVLSDQVGAPFAPRGIVLSKQNILFVADLIEPNGKHGEVRMYNGTTGRFLGNLVHTYPQGSSRAV